MNAIHFVVVAFRVMLLLLCVETSWRYAQWWRSLAGDNETTMMRDLMIGIAAAQAGLVCFTIFALLVDLVPRHGERLAVLFVGDLLIVFGTLWHLRPAWRMRGQSVSINFSLRAVLAIVAAVVLVGSDLQ